MLDPLVMLGSQQVVEESGCRVGHDPEDFNQNWDDGACVVGDLDLVGTSAEGLRDYLGHDQHQNCRSYNCQPIRHQEMDDQRQGLQGYGISDEESYQEEMVMLDHSKDAGCHLTLEFVLFALHHL